MKLFNKHKHTFKYPLLSEEQKPLIISGYGMTEYELLFCVRCGEIIWKLTKDIDNQYPELKRKFNVHPAERKEGIK